jgi:hypothetical protein
MPVNLQAYRARPDEQERIASLLELLPDGARVLEIGARDGHITRRLADRFATVVALDIGELQIRDERISAIRGDLRSLNFTDRSFDVVLCAEVLEHIPPRDLQRACDELARVTAGSLLIGVPYRQDLRVARTRCQHCGHSNPPWGHVNSFDEGRLDALFHGLRRVRTAWIGRTQDFTNPLSALLMEWSNLPWGTYEQDESCVACGGAIGEPPPRKPIERVLSAAAERLNRLQRRLSAERPCWIHCLYRPANAIAATI